MNFLCAVSGRFPENYEIGVRANRWGVEERYEAKIQRTSPGDTLVFMVGGEFRSIHRIESPVFREDTALWPEKDGSLFPLRLRVSDPLYRGAVPVKDLVPRISFMKDKKRWQGTVQGPHGIFNQRLTDRDLGVIRDALSPYERPTVSVEREPPDVHIALHLFREQLQSALADLLHNLGLERLSDAGRVDRVAEGDKPYISIPARERKSGRWVLLTLDTGNGSGELILHVLRHMSLLRQRMPRGRKLRGLILSETVRDEILLVTREIPNLDVCGFRVRFELDPDPNGAADRRGFDAA